MSSGPNISRAQRKRRILQLTLSEEEREKLEMLAEARGQSMSAVVGDLIRAARRR